MALTWKTKRRLEYAEHRLSCFDCDHDYWSWCVKGRDLLTGVIRLQRLNQVMAEEWVRRREGDR